MFVLDDSGGCSLRMTEEVESEDGGSGGGRKERLAATGYDEPLLPVFL